MNEKIRRGYELKSLFLGRPIRPFHFAVTIATTVVAVSNFTANNSDVTFLGHSASNMLGGFALAAAVLLFIGWWATNDFAAEWGLLIATGVWVTRAVYIALTGDNVYVLGTVAAVVLSLAWAVGSSGAYMLERYDHVVSKQSE